MGRAGIGLLLNGSAGAALRTMVAAGPLQILRCPSIKAIVGSPMLKTTDPLALNWKGMDLHPSHSQKCAVSLGTKGRVSMR